jgi:1-deoxyxylulose-5-phosphate synthase
MAVLEPRRALGRTGFVATRLGIGDLADRSVPLETCVATLRRALDAGLNVVDTAPNYEEGYSEEIVGRALAGRREGVFLIDKIDHLDAPVGPQVAGSLARLGLPQVDLFVFHNCSSPADWQRLVEAGGGFDQLEREVAAGRARFSGLSSHHPDVLRAAIDSGRCDVLLFPIGPYVDRRYETEILPSARARGIGTVCFKTFGAGKLLGDTEGYQRPLSVRPRGKRSSGGVDVDASAKRTVDNSEEGFARRPDDGSATRTVEDERGGALPRRADDASVLPLLSVPDCLHYTLTLDPDVALLGLSFPNEQNAALTALEDFRPLTAGQMEDVRRRARIAIQGKGACWWNPEPD